MPLRYLVAVGILATSPAAIGAGEVASPGYLEGHLKISSPRTVELAEGGAVKGTGVDYAQYPLLVLSSKGDKEIAQVTADKAGNYRVALPPGDYVLDAKGRAPGHIRATPKHFSVVANQTAHADFELDTGIR